MFVNITSDWLIKVRFVGEAAIDYGSPKREFFRLLIERFEGSDSMYGGVRKFFTGNALAIQVIVHK